MAKKKFDQQLTEAEAAAQNPAATLSTVPEEEQAKKKTLVSVYIDPALYEDIRDLADYRAAKGEKNHRGQPCSTAALINEAISEYIERNRETLERWRKLRKEI